jgi:hypothetical protein
VQAFQQGWLSMKEHCSNINPRTSSQTTGASQAVRETGWTASQPPTFACMGLCLHVSLQVWCDKYGSLFHRMSFAEESFFEAN